MTLAEAPPYGTDAWVAWRRNGLGASNLAAALCLDPYCTEHELWDEKTGRTPAFEGNPRTRWGHRLERVGVDVWEEHNPDGHPVRTDRPYSRPEWPHLWATPDAIEFAMRVGIEVKVTSAWQQPPERVRVQCLVQMGLADLERVDVVRLSFEDDPAIFPIERDEAAIADILAAGEAWYVRHVIGGEEPPLGEGEMSPKDERYPRAIELANDLRRITKAQDALERQEKAVKADIVASVAGQGVIAGPGFRIDVRHVRGATRTGWKEVAASYRKALEPHMDEAQLDTIEGLFRTYGKPFSSVYPQWDEEEAAG